MNPLLQLDNKNIKLILFGNAILDIGKRVENQDLHAKYNLKLDDQLELDPETLVSLKRDLDEVEGTSHTTSGGSCLNSCKILSQLGEHRTVFCGGIGTDENGQVLEKILDKSNIRRRLQKLDNHPTALCICLIHKDSRCLVANIGASTHFNSTEIVKDLSTLIPQSSATAAPVYVYVEGYFIPHKMSICRLLFDRLCVESGGLLVLNLNATYIVAGHPEDVLWLFERAHLVFGNGREFNELLRVSKKESVQQLMQDKMNPSGEDRPQTCVITDGANGVQYVRLADCDINVGWLEVPKVEENLIVDTTGAGDAFVGGFLHLYLNGVGDQPTAEISLEECIRHGIEVARRKLAYRGCTLREE